MKRIEKLYKLEDLADLLGIARGTVYNSWKQWKHEGRIPEVYRVNGSWRFPESSVQKLIESFKVQEVSI